MEKCDHQRWNYMQTVGASYCARCDSNCIVLAPQEYALRTLGSGALVKWPTHDIFFNHSFIKYNVYRGPVMCQAFSYHWRNTVSNKTKISSLSKLKFYRGKRKKVGERRYPVGVIWLYECKHITVRRGSGVEHVMMMRCYMKESGWRRLPWWVDT